MAKQCYASIDCRIPLSHKCSKCGYRVVSVIALSETYSYTNTLFDGSDEWDATHDATCRIASRVKEIYDDGPLNCHHQIIGECQSCRNKEIWQTSPKKYSYQNTVGAIRGLLIVIGVIGCIFASVLNCLNLIPVFAVGAIALVVFSSKLEKLIRENFLSKKEKSRREAIDSLPEESKPAFIFSLEEMLQKTVMSAAEINCLVNQQKTQEQIAEDIKANRWVCSYCGKTNNNTDIMCKDCGEYR